MAFSNVNILKINKSTITLSSITDSDGIFKIFLNDSIIRNSVKYICASYLKNHSDTLPIISNKIYYKIIINDSANSLSNIIVNSRKSSMLRIADRFIFSPGKVITEGVSALDVIKITPLIQYDNKEDLFSIVNKEGTIIYINNRKSNLPKEMIIATLKSTPADNIKNIEIITNPGSEYPANTTGGVININFKRMIDEGWFGNIMIGSEQSVYNTTSLNGAINYRKNKIGIRLSPFINNSFNYNTSDNLIETSVNQFQQGTINMHRKYLVVGGGLGVEYNIDKRTLFSFNGFFSAVNGNSNQASYTKYYVNNNTLIDSNYSSPIIGSDYYRYNFGNIYFQHDFDSVHKKQLTINIDYNQLFKKNNDLGEFDKLFPVIPNSDNKMYNNLFQRNFFNISEGVDYSSQINRNTKINLGGQASNTDVSDNQLYYNWNKLNSDYELSNNLTNYYKYNEDYLALYVSYTKTFNNKLNGVLGLRVEHTNYTTQNVTLNARLDSNYTNLFPNISFSYSINKKNNFSISVSKKIRRPQIELLFPGRTYYNLNSFKENNPFLQPVISDNCEIMYSIAYKYFFTIGYSLFKNQYSQFIIPITENGEVKQQKTYLNYGNTNNTYFSFFSQQKVVKEFWDVNISANINYSKYMVKSEESLLVIKNISNVNYNFSANNTYYLSTKKKWLGFILLKYYSPVENISSSRKNVLFSTDIGLRKTINNLSLSLYLTDIFKTNSISTILYQSNAAFLYNNVSQNNYTRSISLNVRYSFGNKKLNVIKNKNSANEEMKNRIN